MENRDDWDPSTRQLGLRRSVAKKRSVGRLDDEQLMRDVGKYFLEVDVQLRVQVICSVAAAILGKAAEARTQVANPNRYVQIAIENEPEVWRQRAFALEASALDLRRTGNSW